MGIQKRKALSKQPKQNLRRKMALNTFSPFSMRSPFNDALFRNSWEDGWMIPSRSQNTFKEFKSMFNQDDQGRGGRDQDGGEDQRLGVQAGGAEGVRAVGTSS